MATDPDAWTTVHTEAAGDGGTDDVTFAATDARYVRLQMTQRTSFDWDPARPHWYGYSLFSFEVYGTATQAAVAFAASGTTVPAGDDATVPLILATAAATDTTVRVRSTGGTGVAGTDYTAVDETVTFPAGTTERDRHRADRRPRPARPGPHGRADPVRAVRRPGAGRPHDEHGHHHPARRPAGRRRRHGPRRLRVRRARPATRRGGSARRSPRCSARHRWTGAAARSSRPSGGAPAAGDWFGFTHDIAATDWSAHDGFTFWFLGTGGGGLLRYELKSNGAAVRAQRHRRHRGLAPGQRGVLAAAAQGQPGLRRTLRPVGEHRLRGHADRPGRGRVDVRRPRPVRPGQHDRGRRGRRARSRRRAPRSASSRGARSADLVRLGVTEQEREGVPAGNHVLSGDYQIPSGGWGGYSQNLAAGQDWSSFRGIRLAWYASQPTRPASPDRGRRHQDRAQGRRPRRRALRGLGGHVQGQLVQRRQPLEDRRPARSRSSRSAATSRATRRRATAPST